jgi:hypothetical protein
VRTVSFQGTALTDADRQRMGMQRRQPLLNPHLSEMVSKSLAEDEERKATGKPPARQWTTIIQERGTPYVGDIFKF